MFSAFLGMFPGILGMFYLHLVMLKVNEKYTSVF